MLTIDLDSEVPLTEQIVAGIRIAIATGTVRPRDELPPVRQLANDLGINLNTVARAYRALEGQGLVATARGRGTRVTADREMRPETAAQRRRRIGKRVRALFADAKLAGLDLSDTERLLEAELRTVWSES
jgi:DNA-binding transcriptional regulator YhcF (GntR family)